MHSNGTSIIPLYNTIALSLDKCLTATKLREALQSPAMNPCNNSYSNALADHAADNFTLHLLFAQIGCTVDLMQDLFSIGHPNIGHRNPLW